MDVKTRFNRCALTDLRMEDIPGEALVMADSFGGFISALQVEKQEKDPIPPITVSSNPKTDLSISQMIPVDDTDTGDKNFTSIMEWVEETMGYEVWWVKYNDGKWQELTDENTK